MATIGLPTRLGGLDSPNETSRRFLQIVALWAQNAAVAEVGVSRFCLVLPYALKEVGCGDAERLGNVEEPLMQYSPAAVLDIHQHVARDPRQLRQLFLS